MFVSSRFEDYIVNIPATLKKVFEFLELGKYIDTLSFYKINSNTIFIDDEILMIMLSNK